MILYNTLIGVAAGMTLITIPILARKLLIRREAIAPEGWSLVLGVNGIILTFLGGLMSVTWPLTANTPINIMFGEPTLLLGVLLLAAALFLWLRKGIVIDVAGTAKQAANDAHAYIVKVLQPVSWLLFALGLVLLSCALAIWRFQIVGAAPAAEPITGLLNKWPVIENTFFVILYVLPAIGLLLTPFALRNIHGPLFKIAGWCLVVAGVLFLLFSAMNYYTHMGMLVNLERGTNIRY